MPFKPGTPEYIECLNWVQENQRNAGKAGFNEYGCPLHACNGYIQDAHYWDYIGEKNRKDPLFNRVKMMVTNTPKGTQ